MKIDKEKLKEYKRIQMALYKFIRKYEPESPRFANDVDNMISNLIKTTKGKTQC